VSLGSSLLDGLLGDLLGGLLGGLLDVLGGGLLGDLLVDDFLGCNLCYRRGKNLEDDRWSFAADILESGNQAATFTQLSMYECVAATTTTHQASWSVGYLDLGG
jgi:hypothetical protein